MPDMYPPIDKIWLYHITHIKNLSSILEYDHLLAHNLIQAKSYTNIAHQNIQDRRHTKTIPCSKGGVLHDYVPFYFCRRSPMLYAIHKGQVSGYTGTQHDIIYLVAKATDLFESPLSWVFTSGHAVMEFSDFYTEIKDLNQIDWNLIEAEYWHDTDEDNDRKRRRQAEFLVHHKLPWSYIRGIAVYGEQQKQRVEAIINSRNNTHKPRAFIRQKWYY